MISYYLLILLYNWSTLVDNESNCFILTESAIMLTNCTIDELLTATNWTTLDFGLWGWVHSAMYKAGHQACLTHEKWRRYPIEWMNEDDKQDKDTRLHLAMEPTWKSMAPWNHDAVCHSNPISCNGQVRLNTRY